VVVEEVGGEGHGADGGRWVGGVAVAPPRLWTVSRRRTAPEGAVSSREASQT
jgi:hypothetical protein